MRHSKITASYTNRQDPSIGKYLQEIKNISGSISPDEEAELGRKIRENGDQLALNKLVQANLRFVVSIAKQYQHVGIPLGDLVNEGNIGLIKAAQKFDETRGFKFISYAVWRIKQSILAAISEQEKIVKMPLNRVSQKIKIKDISEKFENNNEREPTIEEIKDALQEAGIDMKVHEIALVLSSGERGMSLDRDFKEGVEGNNLYEVIPDTNIPETSHLVDKEANTSLINRLFNTLEDDREKVIVSQMYGINGYHKLDLDTIANYHKLGRERVRQIGEKAIKKLRAKVKSHPALKSDYHE